MANSYKIKTYLQIRYQENYQTNEIQILNWVKKTYLLITMVSESLVLLSFGIMDSMPCFFSRTMENSLFI